MLPSNPKRAPEAPTEMLLDVRKRADIKLPPNPEMTYNRPIFTVESARMSKFFMKISLVNGLEYKVILNAKLRQGTLRLPVISNLTATITTTIFEN